MRRNGTRSRDDIRNVNGCFGRVPTTDSSGAPSVYYLTLVAQRRNVGRTVARREAKRAAER